MGKKAPIITDDQIAQIVDLHAEGKGRNEISRLVGLSHRAVDGVCADHNLVFDSSRTVAATEARKASLKDLRGQLAYDVMQTAIRANKRLSEPHVYYEKNSRDELVRVTLPEPPLRDFREGAVALSTLVRTVDDLEASLGDPSIAEERSMLEKLGDQIKEQVEQMDDDEGVATE